MLCDRHSTTLCGGHLPVVGYMSIRFLPTLSPWGRHLIRIASRLVESIRRRTTRQSWSIFMKGEKDMGNPSATASSLGGSDRVNVPTTTTAAARRGGGGGEGKGVQEEKEEGLLIPGLPDDVVLDCILSKVSWQQLTCLSSVSRGWRRVIQSRSVYQARTRISSSQTLVVVLHKVRALKSISVPLTSPATTSATEATTTSTTAITTIAEEEIDSNSALYPVGLASREWRTFSFDEYDDEHNQPMPETFAYGLSLHDPSNNSWLQLPSISSVGFGIPLFSELACFQGMLFVLGGRDHETWQPRREVYMLDLVAGNGRWQECANMITPRASFGCGVIGNKLYVAGGHSDTSCALAHAEVYDPELNIWTPIADMNAARSCCTVAIWDRSMYVIGGYTLPRESEEERARYAMLSDDERPRLFVDSDDDEDGEWADSAEVFDAHEGAWMQMGDMKKFNDCDEQACAVFNGDLYSFSTIGVEKFDPVTSTWKQMYRDSWYLEPKGGWFVDYGDRSTPCSVLSVTAVENEIFAMVCMGDECDRGCTLLKSRGFGKPGPRLSWERAVCPVNFVCAFPALCAIEA